MVAAQLICTFLFAYANSSFSHDLAHVIVILFVRLKRIVFQYSLIFCQLHQFPNFMLANSEALMKAG